MFSVNLRHIAITKKPNILTRYFLSVAAFLVIPFFGIAQELQVINRPDTLVQSVDSTISDSLSAGTGKKTPLEAEVKYSADDSITISMGDQKIFLYKNSSVDYQRISLKAHYIEFDMISNTVAANGMPDSSGQMAGKPVFTQGSEKFDSDTMRYNFESRKAIIKYIKTKQGEGFLHSDKTKRQSNGEIHVSKGKYTTCDADHPHFYIRLTKAIAIPGEKIVSGPAFMVLEDIPLPLALPFGFFPNTVNRSSGLLIPTYGEEQLRGFNLRNGGWYFAINDYLDFTLLGSVYSRGTWGLSAASVYKKRYRFNGKFSAEFMNNRVNDDPTYTPSKDFRISWNHSQDPKANPTRKFSANVNFSTTSYEKNHSYSVNDYLTNTKQSSISYSKNWPGRPFNFTANLQQSQSSKTHIMNLTLPAMTFNMNRIYPFRGKTSDGKYNWFENIQVSYSSKLANQISAPDSTFFTRRTLETMKNGFSHSIPISLTNIKIFKLINISPGMSYSGVLYTSYLNKRPRTDSLQYTGVLVTDTIRKLTYAHALSTSLGISASPKLYGMFQSKKSDSYIAQVRHVMTPSASFSFSPDMSGLMPDYYRTAAYPNTVTKQIQYNEYSVYEQYLYGTPTVNGRSGSVSLSLNNNLEMKVRAKNDTTGELKKVSILDNFNFSTSYSPFARSYHWNPVNMTGSTSLFSDELDVRFGATFSPYALDTSGIQVDKYLINETGKLFRATRGYIDLGFRLQSAAGDKKETPSETAPPPDEYTDESNPTLDMLDESTRYYAGEYVDFDIPWSINVDYSWSFSKQGLKASYTHTLRLNGDISITPKWKIGLTSGYDFVAREITTTNFNLHRDLHCWEMRFSMVPFGDRRSFSFTINAKSAILRDVKYNKNKSWYDNF
ncbi:MAG TPA: putative LPS assembly protein LptD [Bacteroidales bacterium]|nr:putative LPS assembly protein LptD [Bacteroidales bacterium]